MIRSELCAIAGLSLDEFNAYLRAGDLPFDTGSSDEVRDEQGRTWSNFRLEHAALLLAAGQLVSAGLSWPEAAALLREPRMPVPRRTKPLEGSYHVARAEFMREGGGEPNYRPRFAVYGGPLLDIVAAAQAEAEQYNRQSARTALQKISLVSLVATDLTRASRVAQARAEEMGVTPNQGLRMDPDAEDPRHVAKQTGWREQRRRPS